MRTQEQKDERATYMREYNKRPIANEKKRLRDKLWYDKLTLEQKKKRNEKSRERVNKWKQRNIHRFKGYQHQYCKSYYEEHKELFKIKSSQRFSENKEDILKRGKEKQQILKHVAIEYYSNGSMQCANCKYNNIEALSIDHINNGGRKHLRDNHIHSFYYWLLKNSFPTGYQVLCMNCQVKKFKMNNTLLRNNGTIHQLKNRYASRERYRKKRLHVISHYSKGTIKCNNCGIQDIDVLTMDHINNNGAEHRKIIGNSLIFWLYKNDCPIGFQVLCMNCNFAKNKLSTSKL